MFVSSRRAHRGIVILLAVALGGCSGAPQGVVRSATLNRQIDVSEAFITPPPGGPAVIAVLENRYQNALAQDIVLANASLTPGNNVIIVRAYGPMGRDAGVETLPPDRVDIVDIRKEMRELLPGVPMEVAGLYAQNRYGPFSYATGRSGAGANCVYAWQKIAPERRVFRFQGGSISWRLRVCDPTADTRSLLLLAYGLTINGYFLSKSWNPYGRPPAPDPRIGQPGATILPEQVVDPTVIAPGSFGEAPSSAGSASTGSPSTSGRVRRTRTARRTAVAPPVLNRPVEGAAVVPRPENTDLAEPVVEGSNLPQTGVDAAPGARVPTTLTTRPLSGPRSILPPVPLPAPPPRPRARAVDPERDPRAPAVRLARFPLGWSHPSDQKSRQLRTPAHSLVASIEPIGAECALAGC